MFDVEEKLNTLTETDVVIVASDGLWDVISNEEAAAIVLSTLGQPELNDCTKFVFFSNFICQNIK